MVELTAADNRSIQAPARVTEEVAEEAVAISFGQGHTALGTNAANLGANAFCSSPDGSQVDGHSAGSRSERPAAGAKLCRA